MRAGVTVVDPATTWVDAERRAGARTWSCARACQLHGRDHGRRGRRGRPGHARWSTPPSASGPAWSGRTALGAEVGPDAEVGPFAYLRPGAALGPGSKVGTYVEVKGSRDRRRRQGAAPVVRGGRHNRRGHEHRRREDRGELRRGRQAPHRDRRAVRTGSDTVLVAPVTIGDGAYTAPGSVITEDVPPGALGVAPGPAAQHRPAGWRRGARARRRPRRRERAERAPATGEGGDP